MRNTRLALALLPVAALMLTACTGGTTAGAAPTTTTSPTPPSTTTASSAAQGTTTRVTSLPAPPAAACQPQQLRMEPATETTDATTISVTTAVKNTGRTTCVIQGYPQVAITGLPPATGNWPRKQLTITKVGPSHPVPLISGDGAVVTLTFTRCKPGQAPVHGPVLLLGVPDGGIETTLEDGSDFTECGDVVKVTAFEAHLP